MASNQSLWSLTKREWRAAASPVALWILVSVFLAMTGPFDTYTQLGGLPRLAYWAAVVALSIGLSRAVLSVVETRGALWRRLAWVPFALILAGMVYGLNHLVFAGWAGLHLYLWLVGVVLAVCLLIELSLLFVASAPKDMAAPDPEAALLQRLPLARRGALIRIEAQDHYLCVTTVAGSALILMRMADAEALLQGADGLRVHRSHWVKRAAVRGHSRQDGRDFLLMADGSAVPVSRNSRAAAVQAGLIVSR